MIFVKYLKTDCGFKLQWILVTLGSFLISLCLIEVDVRPHIKSIEGVIGGAIVGLAQGMVLEQRSKNIAPWWALVSMVSWGLIGATHFGAIGWMAPRTLRLEPRIIFGLLNGLQIGALLGIGQWLVLRQRCKKTIVWIPIVAVAWAIGLFFGWSVGGVLRQVTRLFLSELVGLAVAWVISSAITGFALVRFDNLYGLAPKTLPNKARY
ncbi:MAG: hypothetical protein KME01_00550 [Chroococcus sp. CMT-3BRIN-NPC107]|jgi:hypothetical protein|nr:hypothetical protein [Chroococcus sp. CMT-3BRIN-NPC107]